MMLLAKESRAFMIVGSGVSAQSSMASRPVGNAKRRVMATAVLKELSDQFTTRRRSIPGGTSSLGILRVRRMDITATLPKIEYKKAILTRALLSVIKENMVPTNRLRVMSPFAGSLRNVIK